MTKWIKADAGEKYFSSIGFYVGIDGVKLLSKIGEAALQDFMLGSDYVYMDLMEGFSLEDIDKEFLEKVRYKIDGGIFVLYSK